MSFQNYVSGQLLKLTSGRGIKEEQDNIIVNFVLYTLIGSLVLYEPMGKVNMKVSLERASGKFWFELRNERLYMTQ